MFNTTILCKLVITDVKHNQLISKATMIVLVLSLVLFTVTLVYKYLQQTGRWKIFQARGIPYAEPCWPLGSAHMWRVVFSGDTTFTEMFRTYLGSELEKGIFFLFLVALYFILLELVAVFVTVLKFTILGKCQTMYH